jgi:hypothetical protein
MAGTCLTEVSSEAGQDAWLWMPASIADGKTGGKYAAARSEVDAEVRTGFAQTYSSAGP